MCKRGEYPITVPPLIEFTDGRSFKPVGGDFTEPQCRPIRPKGAAAIGGGSYPRVGAACQGAPKPEAEGPYSEHGGWGCLGGAAVPGGVLQHADGWGHPADSGRRAMRQEGCGAVEALPPLLVWNRQAGSPWKPE